VALSVLDPAIERQYSSANMIVSTGVVTGLQDMGNRALRIISP
jgi:hypothetical protein